MAFKRYIHKHGKKLGPYYYENVRSNDGRVKSVYLGTNPGHHPRHRIKKPLFFLILVLVLILILGGSLFLLQNKSYIIKKVKVQEPDFEIDQILLKVLIRSNEFIEKQVRIMNIADRPAGIDIFTPGLEDVVKIDSSSFIIKPGQTKVVSLKFFSAIPEDGIEQQPGIYIGKLVAKSEKAAREVPIVVEIETRNVLFDMNLNPVAIERRVKQGADTTIEVRLFNLESIDSVNVDVEYFVKDMNGNTITTETETVVVKTQASFFKTISIPKNLKPGPYVFAAIAKFGNSIGTSSYLFEVTGPEIESSFVQFCKNSILCLGLSLTTILLLFALIAYFYFFIGAYLYEKVTGVAAMPKKEKIEASPAKGPGFFERFAIRIRQRRRRKEKEKAEREELERKQDLERIAQERRSQLEKERAKLEEERRKLEEEKRKRAEEKKQPEPKESFFRKIGFFKTPEEKKRIAEQKEKEARERIRAEEQEKRQKELEAKRSLEGSQKKQDEEKKKRRELEEQRRRQLEEEKKKLEEQRLREQAERQKELEKQKALDEKRKLEEERRKKEEQEKRQKELEKQKALEYKRKLEEEKARKEEEKKEKEEQLKRQREAEKQRQELAKAQKLAAIKQLEEKLARNKEAAEQLGKELKKIESEKRQLTSSNNEKDTQVNKVDREILEKSRHNEELSLQKNSLFEHYKKKLDGLAKIRESEKAAKEEKARDLRAKLAAKQEAMVKELEDELSRLSIEKRKSTEKWKRLEIKAKLKIEEQNIEEQIKKEEQSGGKQAIDDDYRKSIEEIGKKQNLLKNEIAQMERQRQEILLEKKNAPRELAAKENELQRILSKLESNAKEREELAAELARLKSELSRFNLGFLKKIISSYKEKSEKARREKEEERAKLDIEKKREEEAARKEKELAEKAKKLEEARKRKEDESKARDEQKRKALEEKERLKAERQKSREGKSKPEIKPEEPKAKGAEGKKPGLFGKLFGKNAQAEEKITLQPSEEVEKKPGIFSNMFAKRREDEGKEETEEAIEEKPKARKSEAEELEEAIRGLDLFQQVEKGGRVKAKAPKLFEKLAKKEDKEKPGKGIFSAFRKKKEELEKPAEGHKETIEPALEETPKKSLFAGLFEKKERKEPEKAAKKPLFGKLFAKKEISAEEITGKKEKKEFKSKKLEKFHNILDSAYSALEKDDKAKAKKLYLEARESYIRLEYNEKKEVYNDLTELYNRLARQ